MIKDEYARVGVPMLPSVAGDKATAIQIVVYAVLTVVVSLIPWFQGLVGLIYAIAAIILGLLLVGRSGILIQNTSRPSAKSAYLFSMLYLALLFVAMAQLIGWPAERGVLTIWIAHTTFCSAYVAVVVSSRLRELDLSIEEAAMDLGAKPWKVFFLITIPMIAPSLAAGGMMSFALSLDDLVLASFVSGPGSTTLPMEVFSAVRLGVKPEINAVASLILLAVSFATFLVWFFAHRAEEKRKKALQQAMDETTGAALMSGPDSRRDPSQVHA